MHLTFLLVCYPSLPFFVHLIVSKLCLLNCGEGTAPGSVTCVTEKRGCGLSFFLVALCKMFMRSVSRNNYLSRMTQPILLRNILISCVVTQRSGRGFFSHSRTADSHPACIVELRSQSLNSADCLHLSKEVSPYPGVFI